MRRSGIVAAMIVFWEASAICQETQKAPEQLNVQVYASRTPNKLKQTIGPEDDLTIFNLNDYKFTTNPNPNKAYKEYQVIKLDGMSDSDVLLGMITGTLERESRFIELKGIKQSAVVRAILDEKTDYIFMSPYEKEYFIASDGTFRYLDGRDLVGSKKVKTYLEKGKPVTATTFFFAMKNKGLIDSAISLRTFIALTTDERVALLNMDILATPKETPEEDDVDADESNESH
jgi:hypothetical protein